MLVEPAHGRIVSEQVITRGGTRACPFQPPVMVIRHTQPLVLTCRIQQPTLCARCRAAKQGTLSDKAVGPIPMPTRAPGTLRSSGDWLLELLRRQCQGGGGASQARRPDQDPAQLPTWGRR